MSTSSIYTQRSKALLVPFPYTIVCITPHNILISMNTFSGPRVNATVSIMKRSLGYASSLLVSAMRVSQYDTSTPASITIIAPFPLVGAPLSGWVSDKIVIKYKRIRGYWYPEDRLRASFSGAFLPFSVLASGLITKYIPGTIGLALNLVCLFISGVGVSRSLLTAPCSNAKC